MNKKETAYLIDELGSDISKSTNLGHLTITRFNNIYGIDGTREVIKNVSRFWQQSALQ